MSDSTAESADAPKIGDTWGDDISEERKEELVAFIAAWDAETDHGDRRGPFDKAKLTGADVFYLAACNLDEATFTSSDDAYADLTAARTALRNHRSHPFLFVALNLAGANLKLAQLTEAFLYGAHLEGVNLVGANLERANLGSVRLEGADLSSAQLQGSDLFQAHLQNASLNAAQLEHASLVAAQLSDANLDLAQLTSAGLFMAQLQGAKLTGISLDQIVLDNTNLTVVSWEGVAPLGDEKRARAATDVDGKPKNRDHRIRDYEAAVRANRLLATALRAQGLAEEADVFAYRAQLMQRGPRFQRRQFGRWLISWLFAALSGYGYRLWRIFVAYGLVLAVLAAIFLALGVHSFADAGAEPWYQALWDSFLVSLSAIHGRAVFEQLGAWTPAAWVAAIESVVGIVIEGVFVAMLIQRLFR
jgi:uncharacterized protein YjbI with pentapeptide repeats